MSGSADRAGEVPTASDRPYVDGRTKSSDELRHEVAELDEEHRRSADEMREEVGETVEELASRLDVRGRVVAGKDEAAAVVRGRVGRAGPAVAAVGAVLAVLLLVLRRRRRRPSG